MKKGKSFAQVVYYLFMFSMGILLALFLPYILTMDAALEVVNEALSNGNYTEAMQLSVNYFDDEIVFQQQFESGGGIVLFSSVTPMFEANSEGEENASTVTKLHKSYAGFVYGTANNYLVSATGTNRSRMIVVDGDGVSRRISLLDYDSDGDGTKDTCSTHAQYGLFFVELDEPTYHSIKQLKLVDKDGNEFACINLDLSFGETFFQDVDAYVGQYNSGAEGETLEQLRTEMLEKSSHYKAQSMSVANSRADKQAAVVVVCYFVAVYLLGDLLIGPHFVIRFFRWLLVKVFKVKFNRKEPKRSEVFGNDYYSKVTLVLDVSELEDFSQSVQIRYNNEKGDEATFTLMKEQNYCDTQRVKAGTYVNMWVDTDKELYAMQNLPEKLVVQGYQMALKVKIIKREEKRL